MKAILVRRLPATNTRPSRWKASAEGVPPVVLSSYNHAPREAALLLCQRQGWSTDLIEGGLPNGDFVFCFNPYTKLLRIGNELANTTFDLAQQVIDPEWARPLDEQREAWDAAWKEVRQ